ncbi:metallophosphoesterase family protein [Rubritalea tangerina]|uniref:Metallophosphoesterase family protein n=1 Tax=Rubritalea tangerina TaxID=430798 RepID=A0ABW4ZEY6_9BACT
MKILPKHFSDAKRSLFQSAVREARQALGATKQKGLVRDDPHVQAAANVLADENAEQKDGTLEVCAKLAWDLVKAHLSGDKDRIEALENQLKYSTCDAVGWAKVVEIYLSYYHGGKEPEYRTYNPSDISTASVYSMPDTPLTVGVIGDWGTGEEVASVVLEEVFKHEPDILIHVGDIYYAGTPNEAQTNFLDIINAARLKPSQGKSRAIPVYNLPGNHDYYSGGQGFFHTLDQLNLPPYVAEGTELQQTSFFCLRNNHWQLQGMDTGYYDHDLFKVGEDVTHLHDSEIQWHKDKIQSADGRKIILFSHHQLFSSFLAINKQTYNPALLSPFQNAIDSGQVAAWLWGHEHLLELYGPHLNLKAGRCVGNGAFPELASGSPYTELDPTKYQDIPPLLQDPNTGTFYQTGISEEVINHGYAILNLNETSAEAAYYQVPGDGMSQSSSLVFKESL